MLSIDECINLFIFLFQLRNLLWSTSKHDVYLMQNYSVMHWSSLLRRGEEVLNVARPLVPTMVSSAFCLPFVYLNDFWQSRINSLVCAEIPWISISNTFPSADQHYGC